ncbi:LOW QUALITY PROTEIN: uncharacterized protein PAF06_019070 [Gastrophryne carolinensis]
MLQAKGASTPMDPSYLKLEEDEELLLNNESYRQAVGALLYIATTTCPDITASVLILCRRGSKPCERDWNAIRRLLQYLKETQRLNFKIGDLTLRGYVDAHWAGDSADQKSTSGYLFELGESSVSWSSRKHVSVVVSSSIAEYMSTVYASQEVIWLKQLMEDLGKPLKFE